MKVSGDESVVGQIRKMEDGGAGVELAFPERMVLVANHQVRSRRGSATWEQTTDSRIFQ